MLPLYRHRQSFLSFLLNKKYCTFVLVWYFLNDSWNFILQFYFQKYLNAYIICIQIFLKIKFAFCKVKDIEDVYLCSDFAADNQPFVYISLPIYACVCCGFNLHYIVHMSTPVHCRFKMSNFNHFIIFTYAKLNSNR